MVKCTVMARYVSTVLLALAWLSLGPSARAADLASGKNVSQAQCGQCHEADDWVGESAASLESLIRDIVAGRVKHKTQLQLSESQIVDVAAYWGTGGKKQR